MTDSLTQLPHSDSSHRAQDDLFRFVNGRWLADFEIPADRAGDGTTRQLYDAAEIKVRDLITSIGEQTHPAGSEEQKVADLYASFMDTEAIERLGLSPLEDDFAAIEAAGDHGALAELMGELSAAGPAGLIGGFVSADAKQSDRYALYLVQAGLHLPDESYYFSPDHAEVREKYIAHIARMSGLAGLGERTGMSDEQVAQVVMDFETAIARHHWDVVACRDAEKTYNKFTRSELSELATGFDFDRWFTGAKTGAEPDYVIVSQPSFMSGMAQVWAGRPVAEIQVWMMFGVLTAYAGMLSQEFEEANFDFFGRVLSGTESMRDRWKRAVSLVEGLLGEAVGKIYVAQEFPPSAKQAISDLVTMLIRAYRSSIQDLPWMSADTKQRALEKLEKFTPKVGYPEVWREYPAEVSADDLVGNVRRAHVAEHMRQIDRLGKEIDRTEWLMTPQTVNAYYHPVMNEIVFPAAILQPPFFDPEGQDAANYGAIGAVIGHEIGHGFDDQGSRYDGDGNLVDWWTAEDRSRFEERTAALITQFDVLVPEGLDEKHHVNGALTIGENIGDLGGLSIAWKAFVLARAEQGTEPTAEEARTFFYAWATAWRSKFRKEERIRRLSIDPHSPEEFRCNQIVKNMDAFHTAFDTTESDAMFLPAEDRVTIW